MHNHANTLDLLCTSVFPFCKIDCKFAFHKICLVSLFNRKAAKFVFSIPSILGQNGPMCFGTCRNPGIHADTVRQNKGQREGPLILAVQICTGSFLHLTEGAGHANQILREDPDGESAELTPCTGFSWQAYQNILRATRNPQVRSQSAPPSQSTMVDVKVRIKDGCRGGREQFTWNSIKEQEFKDRESYLGQSTKVGQMGKFGKYYLHDWYARKRDTTASIAEERGAVQAYEEELMQEALGLKPKKLLLAKKQMNEEELKEFLKSKKNDEGREAMGPQKKVMRNELGEEVVTSNEDQMAQAVRDGTLKGLGFASHRDAKLERIKAQTLGTESELKGLKELPKAPIKGEVMKLEVKSEVKTEIESTPSGPSKVEPEVGFEWKGEELDLQKTAADYSFSPSEQVELLCFPKTEEFMEPADVVVATSAGRKKADAAKNSRPEQDQAESGCDALPEGVTDGSNKRKREASSAEAKSDKAETSKALALGAAKGDIAYDWKQGFFKRVKEEVKEEVNSRLEEDTKMEKDKKEKKKDKKAKKAAKKLKKMEKKAAKKDKKAKKEAKLLEIERAMQLLQQLLQQLRSSWRKAEEVELLEQLLGATEHASEMCFGLCSHEG
eukprot:s1149_g8.t2